MTGGAYVPAEGGITTTNRWLRFDFDNPSHKALKILAGTTFSMGETIIPFDETTSIDLSDYISEPGADYYVFVNADKRVVCSTLRTQPDGYMFIGQFHTLCVDVGDNVTGTYPVKTSAQVGDIITLQNYFKERDLDFYNFYTKTIDAIATGTYYNVATILHLLSGFKACDILPESVWCLNWHPVSKIWDGMVWCNAINKCVDIYIQSGTGIDTRSEYGSVSTINRLWMNHCNDASEVGKTLFSEMEFVNIAMGSNSKRRIGYSESLVTTGGHIDTSGRRMISFIGCEDCCGYLQQYSNDVYLYSDTSGLIYSDGQGDFGGNDDVMANMAVGGCYKDTGVSYADIGPRSFEGDCRIDVPLSYLGGRFSCDVTIV